MEEVKCIIQKIVKLEFKSESYLYNAKCEIDNEWNDGEMNLE